MSTEKDVKQNPRIQASRGEVSQLSTCTPRASLGMPGIAQVVMSQFLRLPTLEGFP
jgi:hypothetical protein